MKIEVETEIAAPRALVFQRATDVANWPKMITGIESVEIETPGPIGKGTRFSETRRMHGRIATETMTFTEIDPPRSFVLTAENHGARYHALHVLTERDASNTNFKMVFSAEPMTLLARVLSFLTSFMAGVVKKQLAADLADIKRSAEAAYAAKS